MLVSRYAEKFSNSLQKFALLCREMELLQIKQQIQAATGFAPVKWDYPAPHILPITVQAADIDGLAHANNACYVQWCERCAWEHSEQLGLAVTDYQALDRGVAIYKACYQYFLPSFIGDTLLVGTWLTGCDGKLRLERSFQILDQATGATVLRGHWLLICTTLSTGKATRFPAPFLEVYGGAVIPVKKTD